MLSIFLPEKVGTSRILSARLANFELTENMVTVCVTLLTSSKTIVEKVIAQPIEWGETPYKERAAVAIQSALKQIGTYDQIHVSIPGSLVVYKELTVPFLDTNRIRMIVRFEVESMLPFPLHQAVMDFVVLNQDKEAKSSTVLVIAARAEDLKTTLSIFQAADVEPTHLSVDFVSLYDVYRRINEYREIPDGSALIDLGLKTTRVAFLQNGTLRLIRHIPRGITTIAQSVSKETGVAQQTVLERILKHGVANSGEPEFSTSLEKQLANLVNDIQFTLNSFSLKLSFNRDITKLLFTGPGSGLDGILDYCSQKLATPCALFDASKVFMQKDVKNKVKPKVKDWYPYTYALCTGVVSKEIGDFNLRRDALELPPTRLITKQWITACVLTFSFLIYIGVYGYIQISSLSSIASALEKKQKTKLHSLLTKGSKDEEKATEMTLTKLAGAAKKAVAEKEELWAPFSANRMRPLEIMLELTKLVDRKRFNVTIEELEITTEKGAPRVEVTGFFVSSTGYHFQEFGQFSKMFLESKTLTLVEEIDPILADDNKGVKFTAKLKPKEL